MKKTTVLLLVALLMLVWSACGKPENSVSVKEETAQTETVEPYEPEVTEESVDVSSVGASNLEVPASAEDADETDRSVSEVTEQNQVLSETTSLQITVTWGDNQVIYELNDSPASDALLAQLPLTVEIEDYSTNEKIFYPPEALEISDTPAATGGAGTLAYYAPWGDVVLFYRDYSENPSLYELGRVVSGGELVGQMTGTVTISVPE